MVNFSTPPGLEGLIELDRQGVDIRPTLLRVLTDQYLHKREHTPDEKRRYTELALRLLDEVDIATRAAVATRLAPHACAPRVIMLQLARDVTDVAEPVLLHSPLLTPADCEAIVSERGAYYASILARRGKSALVAAEPVAKPATVVPAHAIPTAAAPLTTESLQVIAQAAAVSRETTTMAAVPTIATEEASPDTAMTSATAMNDTATVDAAAPSDQAAAAEARELCELFFAAGSPERRLILLNLEFATWPAQTPPAPLARADIWRLETAALRHNTATVIRELERSLGIDQRQARRIVEDELGEPIVAAAKAMQLPADVLQRILLFMNPRVGQSVDRVYELAHLYSEIGVEAARRLVAIMRTSGAAERQTTDTRALLAAAETARRALGEVARMPAPKRDIGTVQAIRRAQ